VPAVPVLEDDAALRVPTVSILHEPGHDTLTAEIAAEACALIAGGQPKADLLFADADLRGGTIGLELAREAMARRPGLQVIHTSGRPPTDGMDALFVEGAAFSRALHDAGTRRAAPHAPQDAPVRHVKKRSPARAELTWPGLTKPAWRHCL
jgi:CheY-like chemotaxis protein